MTDLGEALGHPTLTFELPYPSPPLRSNKRLHHMAEHRIKRDIRTVGHIAAINHMHNNPGTYPLPYQVDIRMIWTVPTKHRRDASSGAPTIKSWVDGVVDAGLLHDDSWVWVKREYCEIEHRPGQPMALRVEISEVT